ncbi:MULTISPECIES: HAD family hydrolase [Rhodopirellula]|uniref:Haloacid dehalogenase-type hydrolase n=1 Tax=Rhodopirellula europaea 6C TaxID=1263867 RepID=M2AI87_9BACT|nr:MULTISPECIES: HAD family phosphatase [Rhodopirellula]EMB16860.1 haloacid dehalogenase-type hydrolase [Rhodopirellula europaea 6C]|tara:strand:+ start:28318 stop:29016 length:699 start_codon:yes stop_codon:yes gene_type:complete
MASDIRFVYFDLGNILVSFDRNLASDNVADLFGGTREASDEILHVGGLQNQLETGLISEEEFAQAVRDAYATLVQPNGMVATGDIMRAISDMFTPIESMVAVLQSLREAKVPIGILSNTCAAHWNWVNGRGWEIMSGPFDVQVVSYEAQSMKPDRVIYETAMKLASECLAMRPGEGDNAELRPEEILFVDDREENVEAALAHGWKAEVCLGGEQAIDVLRRHGFDVPLASTA